MNFRSYELSLQYTFTSMNFRFYELSPLWALARIIFAAMNFRSCDIASYFLSDSSLFTLVSVEILTLFRVIYPNDGTESTHDRVYQVRSTVCLNIWNACKIIMSLIFQNIE